MYMFNTNSTHTPLASLCRDFGWTLSLSDSLTGDTVSITMMWRYDPIVTSERKVSSNLIRIVIRRIFDGRAGMKGVSNTLIMIITTHIKTPLGKMSRVGHMDHSATRIRQLGRKRQLGNSIQ